jgi:hypothetical protein
MGFIEKIRKQLKSRNEAKKELKEWEEGKYKGEKLNKLEGER